jgi:sigma-E factor negative regulatory protein RseA
MMKPEQLKHRELVSALADGQLRGTEFARAVGLATQDEDAAAAWHAYHLVGEVLRSGEIGDSTVDQGFLARFEARLAQQADTLVSRAELPVATEYVASYAYSTRASGQFDAVNPKNDSANQSSYRWKLMAAAASLAAVGAIGWNSLGNFPGAVDTLSALKPSSQVSQVAQAPASVVAAAPQAPVPQVMIRDPHLDALLAAHKQFGGTSALQMPAGFIRNATFEANGR